MKRVLAIIALGASLSSTAQVWKTLPKGVRILGYRNVTTSNVKSNFNKNGSATELGANFRVDGPLIDKLPAFDGSLRENLDPSVYNNFLVGEYKVDADAQFNVQGTGFGYGITDRVMFYVEATYWEGRVDAQLKRTKNNTYNSTANMLEARNDGNLSATLSANLRGLPDGTAGTVQSFLTNQMGYQPLGKWHGKGYGDMETGFMINALDKGIWGVMFYPGVVLPTGRKDDPDILQDVAFGDGQYDIFSELATGYVFNDHFLVGTSFRYTYQAPSSRRLRIPESRDFTLSAKSGTFDAKFGDRFNWMLNTTYRLNDWIAFTPIYRFMYQLPSSFESDFGEANDYLAYNTDKSEHQVQLTTTLSSIQPFLKKKFLLPAQINMNLVRTVSGKNVPNVGRFELELRMLF